MLRILSGKFSEDIVKRIQNYIPDLNMFSEALVSSKTQPVVDKKCRSANIFHIHCDQWFNRVLREHLMWELNEGGVFDNEDNLNGYVLSGRMEIETVHYEIGDHFVKHSDRNYNEPGLKRRLTLVVQLSEKNEYEGGNLNLYDKHDQICHTLSKEKGSYVLFDAQRPHEVTPILAGERDILIIWFYDVN